MSKQPAGYDYGYGLPAVFAALRHDFEAAQAQLLDQNQEPIMLLSDVEVELEFTVVHSTDVGGGLNLKVFGVGFGADGTRANSQGSSHRMTIKLTAAKDIG